MDATRPDAVRVAVYPTTLFDAALTALESDGCWRILREGAVSRAQIGAAVGEPPS